MCKLSHVFIGGVLLAFLPQIAGAASLKQREFGESAGGAYYSDYNYGALDYVPGTEGMSEMEVIQTLRHDIQSLDEQIATCERKRKGWVAATVVGGVGVVGTGIAALVQNSKIQDKKSELNRVKGDVDSATQELRQTNERLRDLEY